MGACKGCTKRTLGCHDTCEECLAYREALDAKKEQIRKAKFAQNALTSHEIENVRKSVRKHGVKV